MRCFLHLVRGRIILTDDAGVVAADVESAVAQILVALRDFLAEDPAAQDDWRGWSLTFLLSTWIGWTGLKRGAAAPAGSRCLSSAHRG